jgi:hypothetical protein
MGVAIVTVAVAFGGVSMGTIADHGPNDGLGFATHVADGTTFDYLLGSADDPNSTFYQKQYGGYHPVTNNTGYVDGAALRTSITIHESGTQPHMKSHWNTYKTFLTHDDKYILAAAERVVGTTADFLDRAITALQDAGARFFAAQVSPANHPCNGGVGMHNGVPMDLDAADNCTPHGRINFFPYQPPPQP